MSKDRFDVLERFTPLFEAPEPSFQRFMRRRERKVRNQRIAAGVVAIVLFLAPVAIFAGLISFDRTQRPGATGPSVPGVPEGDYVIDLNTGEKTPLPDAFTRSQAEQGTLSPGGYAVSPDGSLIAYVRDGDQGTNQIFIAGIDGTGVRQVTHDPAEASSPAWSPDGTKIAYEGYGTGDVSNLFVLDVATGESAQITHATRAVSQPQFTPDGSSLLYCSGSLSSYPVLRSVPVAGGKSTVLFGRGRGGMADACNGSLSPDGSLVTMMGSEIGGGGALRFVANPDGTELRQIPGRASNPAGTWSPDGSRIVCSDDAGGIVVVDIATGDDSLVAEGSAAIWLDDHTLLVDVHGGS
jgi:Tol biopolymer transport system component